MIGVNEEPLIISSDNQLLKGDDWIPLHKRDRLTFLHILGIASGNLCPNLLWMVIPTFFAPLSSKLSVPKIVQTCLLFYGSFSGFAVCPILGVYSDSCMFKYGRRRIFMVIGLVFIILGLLLMMYCLEIGDFLAPNKNNNVCKQILYALSYIIAVTAGNVCQAPARTLCSDVSPVCQQNLMANICSVFAASGGILVNIIGGLNLYQYTSLTLEQFIMIISSILCVVTILITCIVTHEEPLIEKPPKVRPFKQIWEAIKTMPPPFYRCVLSYFLAQVAYFQFSFYFSHFMGKDIYHGKNDSSATDDEVKKYNDGVSWSMWCGAVRYGTQLLYGFINTKISELIGFKATCVFGYTLLAVGLLLFFWINNRYAYLLITLLIGIGFGVAMSVPFAIVSLSTDTSTFGANLGILYMVTVIGEQTSNLGIGEGLGHVWPDNPRYAIGISAVFGFLASISAFWMVQPVQADNSIFTSLTADLSTDRSKSSI